jgi:DNA-binding beta-propeller fold protein YncE
VDVARDKDENYYVVDQGNNRIEVFDRRGRFLRTWGSRGIGKGSFDLPSSIAIDSLAEVPTLYVADTRNNRVQRFALDGKFIMEIGTYGSGNGEFKGPTDLTIDGSGNLYVADPGNNRLQVFDRAGKFQTEWGKYSRRRGVDIQNPLALAWSFEGWGALYVVEAGTCVVQKFDVDGSFLLRFPIHRKGEGLSCGQVRIRIEPRKYTVYISDTENDRVLLFDRNGEKLGEVREARVPFRKPGGVYISNQFGEDVAVADTGNNLIQTIRRRR